jgi:hypothetical protein
MMNVSKIWKTTEKKLKRNSGNKKSLNANRMYTGRPFQ